MTKPIARRLRFAVAAFRMALVLPLKAQMTKVLILQKSPNIFIILDFHYILEDRTSLEFHGFFKKVVLSLASSERSVVKLTCV